MTTGADLDRIDCPGCGGGFRMEELLAVNEVKCPNCGKEWQVAVQDAPGGRFLVNLDPPRPT